MLRRRFPPPWTVHPGHNSWQVQDATGFTMVWFAYTPETAAFDAGSYRMSSDEARRLAVNYARLPELLGAWPPKPFIDDRVPAKRREP
ncbi:hypothetical protein [Phenylobacterium sp.]|uniref:hypothetical protein n=1 Tax=Phenylobacterium sp. TaxID=1871053 RepID=UPI00301D529B